MASYASWRKCRVEIHRAIARHHLGQVQVEKHHLGVVFTHMYDLSTPETRRENKQMKQV